MTKKITLNDKQVYFPPYSIILLQCILFVILYGVWIQPETILVRHLCLIIGAILGTFVIFQNRALLMTRAATPIWLIGALFAWVIFHLVFLSRNPELQWNEFTTIWKRTAIGAIFAIGFGIALQSRNLTPMNKNRCWWLVYSGLALPTMIYWVKYIVTFSGSYFGFNAPDFLMLYQESAKFYIHKSAYVFFCLPVLAIALGRLKEIFLGAHWPKLEIVIYGLTVIAVLLNFAIEKDRNGAMYSLLLLAILTFSFFIEKIKNLSTKNIVIIFLLLLVPISIAIKQINSNPHWSSILDDAKIAVQIDRYDEWKYNGDKGYPINALGQTVSNSNYERIAWGTYGLRLIKQNPLGYGLVERSFGYLGKIQWPDAKLHQSHSAWMDITLGLGIPGFLLLFGAGILAWKQSFNLQLPWKSIGVWGVGATLLLLFTTEVSQRVYIDALIFLILWVSSLSLVRVSEKSSS